MRRNKVKRALEWLKLNHADYTDTKISDENLDSYPEDMPPVSIEYKEMLTNKIPEGTSILTWKKKKVLKRENVHSLCMG